MLSRATGDPRYLYMSSYSRITSEEWEAQGRAMGLDKPLIVQYLVWVKNAAQGDFGDSVHFRRNSLDLILKFLPATLQLSGISFLLIQIFQFNFSIRSLTPEIIFNVIILSS